MTQALFFVWTLIPFSIGLGFLMRPKTMLKLQKKFRKRAESFEKRLFKAHRTTGLAFILVGLVFFLSAFYPVWIFNAFVVARLVTGFLFPHLFDPTIIRTVSTTVWI